MLNCLGVKKKMYEVRESVPIGTRLSRDTYNC